MTRLENVVRQCDFWIPDTCILHLNIGINGAARAADISLQDYVEKIAREGVRERDIIILRDCLRFSEWLRGIFVKDTGEAIILPEVVEEFVRLGADYEELFDEYGERILNGYARSSLKKILRSRGRLKDQLTFNVYCVEEHQNVKDYYFILREVCRLGRQMGKDSNIYQTDERIIAMAYHLASQGREIAILSCDSGLSELINECTIRNAFDLGDGNISVWGFPGGTRQYSRYCVKHFSSIAFSN